MNSHSEDDQLLAAMRARDIEDAVAGIREGIADMEAGRTRPLREIDAEIRKRYGLRSED